MRKQVTAIVLAGVVMALAACGGKVSESSTQQETEPAQEEQDVDVSAGPQSTGEDSVTGGAPDSSGPAGVEGAGEEGPVIENPEGADGPTVTDEEANPDDVPGYKPEEEEAHTWDYPAAGISFLVPEEFEDLKGVILQGGGGETVPGSGVRFYNVSYLGISQEDYSDFQDRARKEETSDEELAAFRKVYRDIFTVYCIDGNRKEEELRAYLEEFGITDAQLEMIHEEGEYTFFFCPETSDRNLEELGEFEEEYIDLCSKMELYKSRLICFEPEKE